MSDETDLSFISADIKKENSKSQLLKDDQVHADQDFYDNLPFNKLRNPPKHVSTRNLILTQEIVYSLSRWSTMYRTVLTMLIVTILIFTQTGLWSIERRVRRTRLWGRRGWRNARLWNLRICRFVQHSLWYRLVNYEQWFHFHSTDVIMKPSISKPILPKYKTYKS